MKRLTLSCTAALALAGGAWGQSTPHDHLSREELARTVGHTGRSAPDFGDTAAIDPDGGEIATVVIGLDGFSGSENIITFDELGGVVPDPGPFSIADVTFSEMSSGTGGPGWRLLAFDFGGPPTGPILTDNAGISDIRIDFAEPQDRAGVFMGVGPATYELQAYDETGNLLETAQVTVTETTEGAFAGFENFAGISRLRVIEPTGENGFVGGIDDLHYEQVDSCANCPCPEDINRDNVVDFADILRILAAWGPCDDSACSPSFSCERGDELSDFPCGDEGCFCFTRFDGGGFCQVPQLCENLFPCEGGACPPGFVCIVDDCCGFEGGGCVTLEAACANAAAPDYPAGSMTQAGLVLEDGSFLTVPGEPSTPSFGAFEDGPVSQPVIEMAGPVRLETSAVGERGVAAGLGDLLFERMLSFNGDDGPFSDADQQIADSFAIFPGATATAATWYGNFLSLGDPFNTGDTWDFLVRIFEDNGGVPQNAPFYETAVTAVITDDGIQQFDDRIYLFTADLPAVEFAGDTLYYFMVLSSTTNSFRWNNGMPTDGVLTLRRGEGEPWERVDGGPRDASAFALFGGGDPCDECPCPEDINRDGVVDFADILRVLAAWGPCPEDCDDCEDGSIERCGDTGGCHDCITPTGECVCVVESVCDDNFQCSDGECPPGFFCCVGTCCGFPICLPVCESADGGVPRFEPGDETSGGRRVRAAPAPHDESGPRAGH